MKIKILLCAILMFLLAFQTALPIAAQMKTQVFEKVQMLVPNGEKVKEKAVRLHFLEDELQIELISNRTILRTYKYTEIKDSEYSFTKVPRWKTGLGLGAAGFLFPPLFLVAIPLGFTKHRRHWMTIKTENDYVVLKLSKSNRKFIIPAFETKTGIEVKGRGEEK